MKAIAASVLMLIFTVLPAGCATTSTTATTWSADGAPGYGGRPGRVAYVREVVQRTEGNPVGGAIAGGVIGALLGGDGPGMVVGALGGAAVGAAVSQGSSETRSYELGVDFYDGGRQAFLYPGYAPFRPGQPVILTPQGLAAM